MLCSAVAVRLDAAAAAWLPDAGRLPVGVRLWVEDVPIRSDEPAAEIRRERELDRPAALRALLLRYCDGPADLVLTADRSALTSEQLATLAEACTGPSAAAAPLTPGPVRTPPRQPPVPDWGLAGSSLPPARPEHSELTVPLAGEPAPGDLLQAALALVLARCERRRTVRVGGSDPVAARELAVDPDRTVAGYLAAASQAPAVGTDELPLASIRHRTAGRLRQVPVLGGGPAVQIEIDPAAGLARVRYLPSHLSRPVVERLVRMTLTVAAQFQQAGPAGRLTDVELFDAPERAALRRLGGACRVLSGPHRRIEQEVARRASEHPDRIAVTGPDLQLTYRELLAGADRGAQALRALGVRPGDLVGVCLDRSAELITVLLAILRAGAGYLPLDPAYPADRLAYTVRDAAPAVVVGAPAGFPATAVPLVTPAQLLAAPTGQAQSTEGTEGAEGIENVEGPDGIAYVIYTSGSTGTPKGVAVPHRNVSALLEATVDDFELSGRDVWTFFHSVAFDFSVWEIWGCLMSGGRLVVVPWEASRSPEEFRDLLVAERVSVLSQTPSAFSQLRAVDQHSQLHPELRLVVLGGEPLDVTGLRPWFDRHPERDCRLVNMFGITETTVHVTAQTVRRGESLTGSRSVGPALPGWSVSIHDADGRLLPPGVPGEIQVAGAGMAAGYLNLPELTAERFRLDAETGQRHYLSGDLGRLLPDGRLEHLGRLDSQVKLRGFRVELGEIRGRLLDDPAVGAAAVVLRQPDPADPASARLDAYVVPVNPSTELDPAAVRRRAAAFLPGHMVPATVTPIAALPLTANGKVDTARLPEPWSQSSEPAAELTHDGTVPDAVRAIWTRVFGIRVRPDDDFFALGGNSLLAVRLLAALRAEQLPPMSIRDLYLAPRCADFASRVAGSAG